MGTVGRPGGGVRRPSGGFHTLTRSGGLGGGNFFGQGQRLVGGRRVGGSGGRSPPDAGENFENF